MYEETLFLTAVNIVNTIGTDAPQTGPHSVTFDGNSATNLTNADPTDLRFSNTDVIIIGGWFKLPNTTDGDLFSKKQTSGNLKVLEVYYQSTTLNCQMQISSSTLNQITMANPTLNTPHFFVCINNPANTLMSLYVDGTHIGDSDYLGDEGSFSNGAGPCFFGGGLVTGSGANFTIDEIFFCKNPPDITAALNFMNTNIYNSGNGLLYADLTAGNKTTMGLTNWWGFDESSGTRKDSKGSANLTPTGGVTATSPIVVS